MNSWSGLDDAAVLERHAIVPPLLELRGVTKSFPGVRALNDVSFEVWPAEVHMLLGENGAGKSTLMKVLCGAYRPESGTLLHLGKPVALGSTLDARRLGIAVIFQEFSLVPHLNIARNIFLGREPKSRVPGLIDISRMLRDAGRILGELGLDLDPRTPLQKLGVAHQQMVEIAKALSQRARVLVMDEPTAALSDRETSRLFQVIRELRKNGVSIIYISHRLPEVFELGDRITVLRDGAKVGQTTPKRTSPDALVRMMVGRAVDTSYGSRTPRAALGEVALRVRGLSSSNGIRDVDLVVRRGEIVGLSGLVGSGRTEVVRAVFGADPVSSGTIEIFGQRFEGGPDRAAALGAALVPESRKTQGLALARTVGDNLTVAALRRLFPKGIFRPARADKQARQLVNDLRIATPSIDRTTGVLSGGNQQKIVIGKWLAAKAELYLFDEPTRGIDVGAKAEIFELIRRLVADGAAVLMVSSEQSEIVQVCDRAYVMRAGAIVGELSGPDLTEAAIVTLAMHHA